MELSLVINAGQLAHSMHDPICDKAAPHRLQGKPGCEDCHEALSRVADELTLISSHVPFSSSNLRSFALRTTRLSSSESESLDPTINLHGAAVISASAKAFTFTLE